MEGLAPENLGEAGYLPLYIGKLSLTFNGPPGLTGLAHRGMGLLERQSRSQGSTRYFPRLAAPSFLNGKQWCAGPNKMEPVFP